MTIANTTAYAGPFYPNGVTTVFPFSFKAFSKAEIRVFTLDDDGIETDISAGLYNVTLNPLGGGSVTIAPALPDGTGALFIESSPAFTQNINFENQSAFRAPVHTEGFDRSAARAIWLRNRVQRGLLLPMGETAAPLPGAQARRGAVLGFDTITGDPVATSLRSPITGAQSIIANSRIALANLGGMSAGQTATLGEGVPAVKGRFGTFVWNSTNLSAMVAVDTLQGVYVAPASDPSGASGAWVRMFNGPAAPEWFGAKRDAGWNGTDVTGTDDTAAIQCALRVCRWVELEEGGYVVSAVTGIKFRAGMRLTGKGRNKSFLCAKAGGGTLAQLEALTQGSVIKRDDFNRNPANAGDNPYVTGCYFGDFGIILNHPYLSVTTTAIQIGVDMRHMRDCTAERVFVGNCTLPTFPFQKAYPADRRYFMQGYGFVCGNVSDSDKAYSGGEANTIRLCHPWELYKNVVLDDPDLSPASAAYHTVVENCDIQAGQYLLTQWGQYGALNTFYSNVLQNVITQPGNANPSACMWIEGYDTKVIPGYIEAGGGAVYILYLASSSKRNVIDLGGYTATVGGGISDNGTNNIVTYNLNGGEYPGGNTNTGAPQRIVNRIIDPGDHTTVNLSGDSQAIPVNATVIPVSGNGAVRSNISMSNGRYLGQRLTITANSWGFRFANAAAIWQNNGPPEMGGGDQQHGQISFVWTASGWLEVARTYRSSTRVPVYVNGVEEGAWTAAGLDLSSGNVFKVNGSQVVGPRGNAVANGVNAAGAPTNAEFNALVTQFNLLLARLRTTGGHGLIAD